MVVGPEVALAGFPGAGFEAADRCLVSFDIRTLPELIGDELMKREETIGEVVVPGAHEVAGELDTVSRP